MSDKNGQSACDHSHYVTLQNSMTGVKIPNRDSNFAAESGQVLHVQVCLNCGKISLPGFDLNELKAFVEEPETNSNILDQDDGMSDCLRSPSPPKLIVRHMGSKEASPKRGEKSEEIDTIKLLTKQLALSLARSERLEARLEHLEAQLSDRRSMQESDDFAEKSSSARRPKVLDEDTEPSPVFLRGKNLSKNSKSLTTEGSPLSPPSSRRRKEKTCSPKRSLLSPESSPDRKDFRNCTPASSGRRSQNTIDGRNSQRRGGLSLDERRETMERLMRKSNRQSSPERSNRPSSPERSKKPFNTALHNAPFRFSFIHPNANGERGFGLGPRSPYQL